MTDPRALDKHILRSHMREIRAEAAARDPDAADKLCARFPKRLFDRFGPVVAGYCPIQDELDVRPLLNRLRGMGGRTLLPRIEGDGAMSFRVWKPDDPLVKGPLGVLQPASDAPESRPGLVLAPLLAFDARGHRLGYGKGYYDRAIRAIRSEGHCFYVGVAYAAQQADIVPVEAHDAPLDWVETPDQSIPLFLARAARQGQSPA